MSGKEVLMMQIVSDRLDEVEKGLHQGRIDLHNLKSRCEHISQKKSRLQV